MVQSPKSALVKQIRPSSSSWSSFPIISHHFPSFPDSKIITIIIIIINKNITFHWAFLVTPWRLLRELRGICPLRRCLRSLRSQGTLVLGAGDVWNPQKRCRKGMMWLKSLHLYCYSEYSWVFFSQTLPFTFFICFGGCCCSHGYNRGEWLPQQTAFHGLTWCQLFDVWSLGWCQLIPWIVFGMSWKHQPDPTSCLV